MHFIIDTQELIAGIATVTKALASKTTMSILEGIYIEAFSDQVLLRCTDLSLQIDTVLSAEVEEEGAVVMPGRLFSEMVRRLPGKETEIKTENNAASIKSGRAKTTIQGENAADYHDMPEVKHTFDVKIKKNILRGMIRQCVFATAQDDTKAILSGVLLEIENGMLSMVALDGFRLALRRESIPAAAEAHHAVVPAKSLVEISRILENTEEEIEIVFSDTHILIDMGYNKIKTRLLDGEFMKYKQILPEEHKTRVRVDRSELLDSIDRVSLMAPPEGKSNLIKCSFAGDLLSVSANNELGRSVEELEVSIIGSDIDIAFNARYFSDVLKVLEEKELYLEMNNNISPCVVRPLQGDSFYYLILPVRLFSGM